jgi:hypothetical protein
VSERCGERLTLTCELQRGHGGPHWEDERPALRAEVERLRTLARFASAILDQFFNDGEFGDLDGGWVQDKAVELGLLVHPETAHDPDECEGCADEPRSCYVLSALSGEEEKCCDYADCAWNIGKAHLLHTPTEGQAETILGGKP